MGTVKYKKPFNTIILDFPQTAKPDNTKEKILIPFFHDNLGAYLRENWVSGDLTDVIRQMRLESEAANKEASSCPVIAPTSTDTESIIKTVNLYVKWCHKNGKSSRGIERLRSLVWTAGYKKGMIPSDVYPDVFEALEYWASIRIKIFTFSTLAVREQKTILNANKKRRMSKFIKFFIEKEKVGQKDSVLSYVLIAKLARTEPANILFITDYELYAKVAMDAGIHAAIINRNKKCPPKKDGFVHIKLLTDITFENVPSPAASTSNLNLASSNVFSNITSRISPSKISPSKISPSKISHSRISPSKISPSKIAHSKTSPSKISPPKTSHSKISPSKMTSSVSTRSPASPPSRSSPPAKRN